MSLSIGMILGPINLLLAGVSLYLLCRNRSKIEPKLRIVIDFTSIAIICAVAWGFLGGTARHIGLLDEQTAILLSQILSTLFLVFAFFGALKFTEYLKKGKRKK